MSKKEYNAREVATAILKKAEQVFKNSSLNKTDPQNMNAAQSAGLKGIKLPSAPKANEKPEMSAPKPQAAAKMPKPLKNFMAKRMEKAEFKFDKERHYHNVSNEKGVHQKMFSGGEKGKGSSTAGWEAKGAKNVRDNGSPGVQDEASRNKVANARNESSKKIHRKVLNELKDMPKPNLPKSEK